MGDDDEPLPRALEVLWRGTPSAGRAGGLNCDRIVEAAIALADEDGLGAVSMARVAERLGCGTMSLYRHVATKDELVTFMVSAASGLPPGADGLVDWRGALAGWAAGLWDVYHRHPWVLHAVAIGPPADPGQLAWLDAGLAALSGTGLSERDKLAAVMVVLHFVRGAAALDIEAAAITEGQQYPALLRRLVEAKRFPALAATLDSGAFDPDESQVGDFHAGMQQLLDGIEARSLRRGG